MARSRQALLRGYLFVGGGVLIAVILIYTMKIAHDLQAEARSISFLFAQFAANLPTTLTEQDPRVIEAYRDVLSEINLPIIYTDQTGRPRVWAHIGVNPALVTESEIRSLDPENPPRWGPLAEVLKRVKDLDRQNDPLPIRRSDGEGIMGRVHYGESRIIQELRLFPLIELSIVLIFFILAVLGYRSIKENEQRSVWMGMARETAHQLGTPISSLMGWTEVLRERVGRDEDQSGPVVLDRHFVEDVLREMEKDTVRLEKVAARFSHVGSVPRLEEQDIVPVLAEAVLYLQRRMPQMGSQVEIREIFEEVPHLNINRELMAWVIENLLRNALDSVDKREGIITVSVTRLPREEAVDIRVADNGRGMTAEERRRVFEPGYTTKRRGWGLGLSLARRIVEEYHGGRIFVERSAPGEGSTLVIRFPV